MAAPAARLSTLTMTREAITIGFDAGGGFLGRTRCSDITRFRCAGRRFISITHPDYVDHVLHRARLKYVKSNDYEPIRAAAGVNLLTDEGDSWGAHRATLNPTFARRRPAPHRAAWPDRTVGAAAATRVRHEDDIIDGDHIRPGTTVMIPIHHIHHDERWWPDPEAFDPRRFTADAAKDRPRSAYLPFGGGRRICIGQSFALMEMVLMAAIMSQRFTFDVLPDHPVERESTLTLRPKRRVHVIARRREAL